MTPTIDRHAPRNRERSADPAGPAWRHWLADHARRRGWALLAMVMVAALSMGFSFVWEPFVHHTSTWAISGDVWYTFRVAHLIGWGDIGGVYNPAYGQIAFPGLAVVLAPVAMLASHLQLSESFGAWNVAHPTAWLLLGPVALLVGASCLLAFDAMAEELGVARRRRLVLLVVEAAVVFFVVTLWSHPEDLVATGLATYALVMGHRSRWTTAAWLWGAAIAFQPLVLVIFPVALAVTPAGRRIRTCVLAVIPSAALLAGPLLTQWDMTTQALLRQPNNLQLDHATPWVALTTRIGATMVTSGPGRTIALVLAVGLGLVAVHLRPSLVGVVWLAALALSLRCVFEAVMDPFYLGPPFAIILVACAVRRSPWRLMAATGAFVLAAVLSSHRLSEWVYWTPLVVLLAMGLAAGFPGRSAFGAGAPSGPVATAARELSEPSSTQPLVSTHR